VRKVEPTISFKNWNALNLLIDPGGSQSGQCDPRPAAGLSGELSAGVFGGLDEGLVSRDRGAIREKVETEPKIRKWFQDLATASTYVKIYP